MDLSREGFSTAPHIFAGNRSEFRNRNHKDDSQHVLSLLVGLLSDCQLRLGLATRERLFEDLRICGMEWCIITTGWIADNAASRINGLNMSTSEGAILTDAHDHV